MGTAGSPVKRHVSERCLRMLIVLFLPLSDSLRGSGSLVDTLGDLSSKRGQRVFRPVNGASRTTQQAHTVTYDHNTKADTKKRYFQLQHVAWYQIKLENAAQSDTTRDTADAPNEIVTHSRGLERLKRSGHTA